MTLATSSAPAATRGRTPLLLKLAAGVVIALMLLAIGIIAMLGPGARPTAISIAIV